MFRDPGTQWMVFLCAGVYFVAFSLLLRRGAAQAGPPSRGRFARSPDFWLSGLLLISAAGYFLDYTAASANTQALALLAGVAIGKGFRLGAVWCPNALPSPEPVPQIERRVAFVSTILLLLLVVAALWHPEAGPTFQYRGNPRWNGPWTNPNTFGLLMGVGVVLAAGLGIRCWRFENWRSRTLGLAALAAGAVCGAGLLKSYSRGAWVGTAFALGLLGWLWLHRPQLPGSCYPQWINNGRRWLRRAGPALAVLVAALALIAFWQFRHTQFHPVRRAFSVGNRNDFSWRNRVAAWEGALAMMADRPWAGFGWGRPERVYDQFYRPARVSEGMAFQLNHYFVLGTSAGLPALICFVAYLGLVLRPPLNSQFSTLNAFSLCRAAAVVLLAGLWFDGGLFSLATAAPLWILLELSRPPPPEPRKGGMCIGTGANKIRFSPSGAA